MTAETCERCHRPKAATYEAWIADRQTCFRHSQYADSLGFECEAAREAWLLAEIARLTAALAEATKPRWDGGFLLRVRAVARVDKPNEKQDLWRAIRYKTVIDQLGAFATEAEAKATAEQACGVTTAV